MNDELNKKLVEDFPVAFRDYGKPDTQTCMTDGCTCRDGWEPLVRELCSKLSPTAVLGQVKEKFGELTVYLERETCTPADLDLCEEYAKRSLHVCEFCGKPGEPRFGGWVKTLCDECAEHRYD